MIRLSKVDAPVAALPDMTALLDVITLMLIFLILIAHPATQVLSVHLPQAQAAESVAPVEEELILVLRVDGWELSGRHYKLWAQVEQALTQSRTLESDPTLRIQGAADAPMQRLVTVLDYARRNGIAIAELEVALSP